MFGIGNRAALKDTGSLGEQLRDRRNLAVLNADPGFNALLPMEQRPHKIDSPNGKINVPPGIFGSARNAAPRMPGVIGGFAGGTWNADGSPATPDRDGSMLPLPGSQPTASPALDAQEAGPSHWSVEGFDRMRRDMTPTIPQQTGPLGHSMRQGFDYDAALKALAGDQKGPKTWQLILAGVGDAMSAYGGRHSNGLGNLLSRRNAQQERMQDAVKTLMGWRHDDWARQNEADLRASSPFTSGRDRVVYDPATGESRVIYDGPEDFETYAGTLGLEPGSDEYFAAVEDYVLRGNGPTAHGRDLELDDHRTDNDRSLEAYRHSNRVGMERMRQGNRQGMVDYRNANPAPARPRLSSSGSPRPQIVTVKTPSEASKLKPGQLYKGPDGVVRER